MASQPENNKLITIDWPDNLPIWANDDTVQMDERKTFPAYRRKVSIAQSINTSCNGLAIDAASQGVA